MKNVYQVLETLAITYIKHDHPAVFTVEEANKYHINIGAGHSKNLFLQNKTETAYYLVVMQSHKRADFKKLASKLGESKFSFGSAEKMFELLGLTPGSVSPFGLINDENHVVNVLIDEELMKLETVAFHPNINTATLVIKSDDFKKYLESTGNTIIYIKL